MVEQAMMRSGAQRRCWPLSDGEMAGWVWPNPGAPVLIFAHANGFCASAYRRVLAPLADRFEIVAPDLRGHGRTRLPADPDTHRSWDVYARDMAALIAQLPAPPAAMAGHSMGAVTTLLTASRLIEGGAAAMPRPRLALIEPVILPRPVYWLAHTPLSPLNRDRMPIARQARRRRNGWPDRAAAATRYGNHPTFRRWGEGVLADYLLDGLSDRTDGTVGLACDPMWEAANYESQGHDIARALRRAGPGALALKAEHASTVMRPAALERAGVTLTRMPGVGHLAPMEAPDRVSEWLSGALAEG